VTTYMYIWGKTTASVLHSAQLLLSKQQHVWVGLHIHWYFSSSTDTVILVVADVVVVFYCCYTVYQTISYFSIQNIHFQFWQHYSSWSVTYQSAVS